MTLVKYKPFKPFSSDFFDNFFNDLSSRSVSEFLGTDFVNATPSINVIENDRSFEILVAAPGLEKNDFNVSVDNDQLIISASKEKEEKNEDEKFMRREFNYSSFKRSFHLSDKISREDMSASYKDGILTVTLLKTENEKDVRKTIEIS